MLSEVEASGVVTYSPFTIHQSPFVIEWGRLFRDSFGVGIALLLVVIEEAPQGFDAVAIGAQLLACLRPQKHAPALRDCAARRVGWSNVRLVAGQAGDRAGLGWLAGGIESRHVSRLPRASAIHQSHVRVVHIFRDPIRRTTPPPMAAGASVTCSETAGAALDGRALCPDTTCIRIVVRQVTCAAWAGLGGGFASHVASLRRRRSQVVERPDERTGSRVTNQAEARIRSRQCESHVADRAGLMNIVTRHAYNVPLRAQGHILWQVLNAERRVQGRDGLVHVRR